MSLDTRTTFDSGSWACRHNAASRILWSLVRSEKTVSVTAPAQSWSMTIFKAPSWPLSRGTHSCTAWSWMSLSNARMHALASKCLDSFPTLKRSNSSKTVMGKATLLSSKFFSAVWSNSSTHVSKTKILVLTVVDAFGFRVGLPEREGVDCADFESRLDARGVAMPPS